MRANVAVVDDDPDMVHLIREILADHHEVTTYTSGRALLDAIAGRPPACVLLDIDLGDMNGMTVLRSLRADDRTKHIPVIALTTHSLETERAKYLKVGFDDYVSKPFQADVLLATLETALEGGCAPYLDDELVETST